MDTLGSPIVSPSAAASSYSLPEATASSTRVPPFWGTTGSSVVWASGTGSGASAGGFILPDSTAVGIFSPKATYYVAIERDQLFLQTSDFLAQKGLLARTGFESGSFILTTSYLDEADDFRRKRRSSYFLTLSLVSLRTNCSKVEVRWLVESRGYHELTWRADLGTDPAFTPMMWAQLSNLFTQKPCL